MLVVLHCYSKVDLLCFCKIQSDDLNSNWNWTEIGQRFCNCFFFNWRSPVSSSDEIHTFPGFRSRVRHVNCSLFIFLYVYNQSVTKREWNTRTFCGKGVGWKFFIKLNFVVTAFFLDHKSEVRLAIFKISKSQKQVF